MSLEAQFLTLAMMIASGIGMGAAFDGYRVVSHELRIGRLWIPVLDLLYWLAATLVVFRVLTETSEGEVRFYVFIGLFIGISFYFWLLSGTVIKLIRWSIGAARAVYRFTVRAVEVLIVKPFIGLYRVLRLILGFMLAASMFLLRIVLQLLRPFWQLLRWLLSPVLLPVWQRLTAWSDRIGLPDYAGRIADIIRRLWNRWFLF